MIKSTVVAAVKQGLTGKVIVEEITQELKDNFDPLPLTEEVEKRIGRKLPSVSSGVESRTCAFNHGVSWRVEFTSGDVAPKDKISKIIFKNMVVANFGGKITVNEGQLVAWVPLHFSYEHPTGGSNGREFMDAHYNFNTKQWKFSERV